MKPAFGPDSGGARPDRPAGGRFQLPGLASTVKPAPDETRYMSDKSFTLLEISLGDGEIQIGPKSLGSGGDAAEGPDETDVPSNTVAGSADRSCPCPMCSDGCDCLACKLGKTALVLGLVSAIAVALWKALGSDGLEELDEVEELID